MSRATWWEGWTMNGRHLHLDGDPFDGAGVLRIDGVEVPPARHTRADGAGVSLERGSVRIEFDGTPFELPPQATLILWRTAGQPHYETLNGEPVLENPPQPSSTGSSTRAGE
jgi:hypothetical protein